MRCSRNTFVRRTEGAKEREGRRQSCSNVTPWSLEPWKLEYRYADPLGSESRNALLRHFRIFLMQSRRTGGVGGACGDAGAVVLVPSRRSRGACQKSG